MKNQLSENSQNIRLKINIQIENEVLFFSILSKKFKIRAGLIQTFHGHTRISAQAQLDK
jgi:hypothetical protein